MKRESLYEAIFKRKSIRKYNLSPLDENSMAEITKYLKNVKPLLPHIKTEMNILCQEDVRILLPIKAPHYLILYSEDKDGYLTNAGYMLQQVDLFLSSKGIGSCYLGMAQPKKHVKESSGLEFVMVIAFGHTKESLYRENIAEFNRKSLLEITDITNNNKLLEAVRLAPSATNSQPWFFTGGNGIFRAHCMKHNAIKALIYEKMNKIDMGIALCHLAIAAAHYNKVLTYVQEEISKDKTPKGYYYITTININDDK